MNPQDQSLSTRERVGNNLTVMQPGEKLIAEIKRHPIGLIIIYIVNAVMLIVIAVLVFGLIPQFTNSQQTNTAVQLGAIVLLIFGVMCAVFTLIATKVYWSNTWIITSDSLTQVSQTSLFSRQSSQLSMENIEDVTAEQNGILTHIFNYGVLKAETAGERSKFQFIYCPNPNYYAREILAAREAFAQAPHHPHQPTQISTTPFAPVS